MSTDTGESGLILFYDVTGFEDFQICLTDYEGSGLVVNVED
jgi:hypothetical protein